MPFLTVRVDGRQLASVDTVGRTIVAVHVGGTRVDDDYADLSMTGGIYGEVTEHRIWVDGISLVVGQVVEVEFSESGISSGAGQTIEELYPNQSPIKPPTGQENAEMFAELRGAAPLREGFTLEFVSSMGVTSVFRTDPMEHGFGFSVLWNDLHPERASVSLHGYTIGSVEQGAPGRYLVREKIMVGSTVRLALVA